MAQKSFFKPKAQEKETDFLIRLKTIRNIPDSCNSVEYRQQCYDRYKKIVPLDKHTLATKSDEEVRDILIAEQLVWRDKLLDRLKNGARGGEIYYQDLVNMLRVPIQKAWQSETELGRNQQGLDFLKDFVRDIIYKTGVKGKYSDPTKNADDVRSFHRAMCMCYILNPELDRVTISKLATVIQLTGSVLVVSNFRPLSAAAIWQKYAIDKNKDKKEINILAPSEGFFGRLLSSYYIAHHNRKHIINYHSFDPNTELKEPSENLISLLKNYGGLSKVTNWNPTIHWHGSEVPEANLFKSQGIKFDCIQCSPPYGLHEMYVACAEIFIATKDLSYDEVQSFITYKTETDKTHIVHTTVQHNLKVGDKYIHNGKEYNVVKVNNSTQSHSLVKTTDAWRELFFRKTVQNCNKMMAPDGFQCWNVANVKTYPTLEADVLRVCQEEGLELVDTLHYVLSRRPGQNAKLKPPYEPFFIFRFKK